MDQIRVQGSGFGVQGSGFRVQGLGFRVQGSGFRVQASGFRNRFYHRSTRLLLVHVDGRRCPGQFGGWAVLGFLGLGSWGVGCRVGRNHRAVPLHLLLAG